MATNHNIRFENGNKYQHVQQKGKSKKGCIVSTAKTGDGEDVFMTTWTFNSEKISKKCPINCEGIDNLCSYDHCDTAMLIKSFKKRANYLIQNVDHTNLVRYIDVSCTELNETITIHLVQEYIKGGKSIRSLLEEGTLPNLPQIAEWFIKVISYLEKMNPKITHGYIDDGSIFIDKAGVYRFADFNLVPYLMFLKETRSLYNVDDLKALGAFVDFKHETVHDFTKDFVRTCRADEKPSCQELLAHKFLSSVHIGEATTVYSGPLLNQFEIIQVLGAGAFGSVVKVKQPANQEYFAMKIIKIPIASKGKYTKVKREVQLIPKLSHKNIVKYWTSWEQTVDIDEIDITFNEEASGSDSGSGSCSLTAASSGDVISTGSKFADVIIIQMELCNMDLRKAISEGQAQNKSTRLRWFEEILNALKFLHEKDIIHRDLTPANILLDSHGRVKISDFGLAITVDLIGAQRSKGTSSSGTKARSSQTGYVGTSCYVAPELNVKASLSDYEKEADVYSLGIVFFEMLHPPFQTSMERAKTLTAIRGNDIEFPSFMQNNRDCYTEVEIIRKMLDHNPKNRPTAASLIRSDLHDEGLEEICETSSISEDFFENENGMDNGDDIDDEINYESDYMSETDSETQ